MIARHAEVGPKATPEETRTRILDATREIYAQKGFRGTTTREVAERAGVNEATLFRHFGNKVGLVEAMLQCACEGGGALEHLDGATGDVRRDLKVLGVAALQALERKRDLILITLAEEPRDPTGFDLMWRNPSVLKEHLTRYFEEAAARGVVRGEPALLARFFMGMLFAHVLGRRVFGSLDYETVADQYVEIFLNGIMNKENDRGSA